MLSATCTACGTAGQFMPFLAGQRVKCKACPGGWVQLPPPPNHVVARIVPSPAPPPPARPVQPPPAPPPPEWKPKYTAPAVPNDPVQPDPPGGPSPESRSADPQGGAGCLRYFGGLFLFFGVGSVVLHFVGAQFRILAWLEPFQPAAGFVMAGIGAVLVTLFLLGRR
jgi:hypothetical protein